MPQPAVDPRDQNFVRHGIRFFSQCEYRFGSETAHAIQKIFAALRDPAFVPPDETVQLPAEAVAASPAAVRVAEIHTPRTGAESRRQKENIFRDAFVSGATGRRAA